MCFKVTSPPLRTPFLQALSRITPVSGPAEAAGTTVTIYGRGFVNTTKLACLFGLAPPVPATFVSPNELFCESPPLYSAVNEDGEDGGLRWSSLSEIRQREAEPLTGSRQLFPGAHYHPLFSQRAVGVEVRGPVCPCGSVVCCDARARSIHTAGIDGEGRAFKPTDSSALRQ